MTREDAKVFMRKEWRECMKGSFAESAFEIAIEALEQPERKKGKWIYGESEAGNDGYYCSKCGNFVPWKYDEYDIDFIKEFLFCNKCGAEMRNSVETAKDIVHEAINNSVWSDAVDTAKIHKVVDDKYAEMTEDEA